MIEMDSADLTNEEREEACAFVNNSGYDPKRVKHSFQVRPALGETLMFSFDHYRYDENGKMVIGYHTALTDPIVIYASDRLGWFQHYLTRTGRTIDD